ncbi:MAG: FAD-binding protein [Deltaproteobacteria bacterium]|nr:FAD-binding protein [Deltaproteobacteria bacterium]MBW2138867.1 FAD-binding protein [Deltaproteobacteria bacterium]
MSWEKAVRTGTLPEWPYPLRYGEEKELETDVLVLGGGIAGCWAAISAAKKGLRVAILEKGATIASGSGGAGCDHWVYVANPCSDITPEEMVDAEITSTGGYTNCISRYISSREAYDALVELEEMGGKVRDTEDEFKGAEFRDEKTKFCFAYDYQNKLHFRVWGSTFKPALYKACKKLGVEIYDRTMATSLLTEGGKHGSRVIGATGLNIRTGEFVIVRAKATVLCLSRPQRVWQFSTELTGMSTLRPQTCIGNGHAMAWRAGAELTQMEKSTRSLMGSGLNFPMYGTGNPFNTWYACSMVDADGKEIPWVDRDGNVLKGVSDRYRPAPGQRFLGERSINYNYRRPTLVPDLLERVQKGEFRLPLYADLPGMPEMERRVIFGMMVGEEGKTKIPILKTYRDAGFDPDKDLLQSYMMLGGEEMGKKARMQRPGLPQQRTFGEGGDAGGLLIDWDLKTTLDGLYAAGDQLFAGNYHHHAAATGRYAGRKAAEYALVAGVTSVERQQVEEEKARVYAPVKRQDGIDWKELNAGLCRVMQTYCSEQKTEDLLNLGLLSLKEIEENDVSMAYAADPHKLGRVLDVLDLLTCDQIIINACLARKASSQHLDFYRLDYPQLDPPQWQKWITVRLEGEEVKTRMLSIDFWGKLKENYEARNRDYEGWYKG